MLFAPVPAHAISSPSCWLSIPIVGAIGPATLDLIERVETHRAAELGSETCSKENPGGILLEINTPGGNLQTTRLIVERILSSKVPFACWVGPAGGRAGSAGAIILQACHVAAAEETTNIGAATPISGQGEELPKDIRAKLINDTVSWVENLAQLRGRNRRFAREIIESAKSSSARETMALKAIDFVAANPQEMLQKSAGRLVQVRAEGVQELVKIQLAGDSRIIEFDPGLRHTALQWIADPELSYLLFMGSLGLLYFEITHPGTVVPGVLGAMGLVTSMIAFHKLNVSWGGFALLILGVVFLILEIFVTSFGVLAIAGIASMGLGAVLLFDPATTGYSLPLSLILPPLFALGAIMLGIGFLLAKLRRIPRQVGKEAMLGAKARIVQIEAVAEQTSASKTDLVPTSAFRYRVDLGGELWHAHSDSAFKVGDTVQVLAVEGLKLRVGPRE